MLLGLVLIAIAAASWGTTGATMTLLSREAAVSPLLVGWSRLAIAAPVLVAAAAGVGRFGARHPRRSPWPSLADLPLCAALGLAMAAYQVCYFRAVTLVGVAPAALLAICSAPLLIAVLAALFLGERLTPLVRLSPGPRCSWSARADSARSRATSGWGRCSRSARGYLTPCTRWPQRGSWRA
jgi:DME family drug/metabolite transporter